MQTPENGTTTTPTPVPIKPEQRAVPEPERTADQVHEALMTACPGESVPRKHANELLERCRANDPRCTGEQIASVIYQLRLKKRKGSGSWFFVVAVPEHFPLEKKPAASESSHRQQTADSIELARATLADPKASEHEKLLARLVLDPADESRAMKAGSR